MVCRPMHDRNADVPLCVSCSKLLLKATHIWHDDNSSGGVGLCWKPALAYGTSDVNHSSGFADDVPFNIMGPVAMAGLRPNWA